MKRTEINIANALLLFNKKWDEDRKILSDRYHELELSHNRKVNLLRRIEKYLNAHLCIYDEKGRQELLEKIDLELSCYGYQRERWESEKAKGC